MDSVARLPEYEAHLDQLPD